MDWRGILRLLIGIDLAICALFALPWVSGNVLATLDYLNDRLGFAGGPLAISPAALFFVNFAGLLGVAFNAILLKSDNPTHHRINNCARLGVIMLLFLHGSFNALPQIFYIFVLSELAGLFVTHRWLAKGRYAS